jgi:hypothetical protein
MYKVHGYLDNERVINWRMEHLPRVGDTMRFEGERYGKVTEVVWCMDELSKEGQRVNIRIASEPANARLTGPKAPS